MHTGPLISVVIPTYNRAELVGGAIRSVLDQTYSRLELIVVDDGSVDNTADVVSNFIKLSSASNSPEIRYLYQSNTGQSGARNTGIAAARGEWIGFLDSDDYWLPEKLEWQVRAIEQFKKQCGVCVSDARLVNRADNLGTTAFQVVGRNVKDKLGIFSSMTSDLAKGVDGCWVQVTLVRTDLAREVGGFDHDLHFMEDHDFLFRLSLLTSFCYVNLSLATIDRASTATDPDARIRAWDSTEFRLKAQQRIFEKWLTLNESFSADIRATVVGNLRGLHSAWANLYLQRGQFELARQAVGTAMSYEFTPKLAIKWLLARITPRLAQRFAPSHSHRS